MVAVLPIEVLICYSEPMEIGQWALFIYWLIIIMKGKKAANIQLSDILGLYLPQQMAYYFPQQLKQQLQDIRVLAKLAVQDVPAYCSVLRKKANDSQKGVDKTELFASHLQHYLFINRATANYELAYNILTLSAPPLIASKPKPKPIAELKLRFLESKGVTNAEWALYLRPEKNILAVSVPERRAEVMVGVEQQGQTRLMGWVIIEASLSKQRSPQLLNFFRSYFEWSRNYNKNWQRDLISDIKQLLHNLPAILVLLELRRAWRSEGEHDVVRYSWESRGSTINAEWKCSFSQYITTPTLSLAINGKQMLRIIIKDIHMQGQLTLTPTQMGEPVRLNVTNRLPQARTFLELPKLIYSFDRRLTRLHADNSQLLSQECKLFVRMLGMNWLAQGVSQAETQQVETEGVWMIIPIEGGALLFVEDEGMLRSKQPEKGLVSLLIDKNITLADIGRHLRLQQQLYIDNKSYQFKIYDIRLDKEEPKEFKEIKEIKEDKLQKKIRSLVYEFRSIKYQSNSRYQKISRLQQAILQQQEMGSHQGSVILMKVGIDFSWVRFSSWRYQQGPKGQIDCENYLRKQWQAYKKQLVTGEKLSWIKVAEAIGYLCRCHSVQRILHKRMSQDDRRVTAIDLN